MKGLARSGAFMSFAAAMVSGDNVGAPGAFADATGGSPTTRVNAAVTNGRHGAFGGPWASILRHVSAASFLRSGRC